MLKSDGTDFIAEITAFPIVSSPLLIF